MKTNVPNTRITNIYWLRYIHILYLYKNETSKLVSTVFRIYIFVSAINFIERIDLALLRTILLGILRFRVDSCHLIQTLWIAIITIINISFFVNI